MEEEKGVFFTQTMAEGASCLLQYLETQLCDISQPALQSRDQAHDEVCAMRERDRPHFRLRHSFMPASLPAG